MALYYTILTHAGLAKVTNAQLTSNKVEITQVAVGDANGNSYQPTGNETALKGEKWRGGVSSVEVDSQNSNWVVVEAIVPATVGGFTLREVALFDVDGDMIAIGNYPNTYKPIASDGSTMDLALRTIIEVGNASNVTLKIDPNIIVASRKYVDDRVAGSIGNLGTNLTALDNRVTTHLAHYAEQVGDTTQLQTTNKQIVSAINEVFQTGNNVKSNTVDALLSVDDSLPIIQSSAWADIIAQIGNISTGIRWASGNQTSSNSLLPFSTMSITTNAYHFTVAGLEFLPKLIFYTDAKNTGYFQFSLRLSSGYIHGNSYLVQGNAYVNSEGFRLPLLDSPSYRNADIYWIAFE